MIERVPYAGWPNCYRLTDGRIELVATSDVGPRIVRLGRGRREPLRRAGRGGSEMKAVISVDIEGASGLVSTRIDPIRRTPTDF